MSSKLTQAVNNATGWWHVGKRLGISAEAARIRAWRAGSPVDFDRANFRAIITDVPDDEHVEFLLEVIENMQARHCDHEIDEHCVDLTPQERRVMAFLYDRRGRVCSRDAIFEICWAHKIATDEIPEPKILDVTICKARKKMPDHWRIKSVWGRGYILETQQT